MMFRKRKPYVLFLALLIASTVLTGCGQDASETPITTEEAGEVTEEAVPAQSDIILSVTPGGQSTTTFTYNFNPLSTTFLFPATYGIYEPLMINNRVAGVLVPWLAEEYTWGEDNLTLTFTLREGVKWSDGEPFTAGDVVFTFDLLKNVSGLSGSGLVAVAEDGYIESVTAPDDQTVVFTFSEVYTPGFYDIIPQNIVPEHIWSAVEDPVTFTNTEPVGTGPFTEVVSMQDQVYEIHRNPYYWQPGQPTVKGLRVLAFSGSESVATMFVNGDVDWTGQFFSNVQDAVLSKNSDLQCWWPTAANTVFFIVNGTKPTFSDPIVRKAISMSFDRELLIELAVQGNSTPADVTGLSQGYAFWKVEDPSELGNWTEYDLDAANDMLDEAGYEKGADGVRTNSDGSRWSFELLMVNGFSDWLAVAPTLKTSLESIGFEITINNYDPGQTFPKWFMGDFDMSLNFGVNADSPYSYYLNVMSEKTFVPVGEATGFGQNIWRMVVPGVEEQLEIFSSTGDLDVQLAAAHEMQRLFAEYAPTIPLWASPTYLCYSTAQVTGWASEENLLADVLPMGINATGDQLIQMTNWEPNQ